MASWLVKVPRRTAEEALAVLEKRGDQPNLVADLVKALAPTKRELAQKARQKEKRTRRSAKHEATVDVRDEVMKRAAGRCECCGDKDSALNPLELDHFGGRGKEPETVQSVWLLCRRCHRAKTNNTPSAVHWLEEFVRHCERHNLHVGRAAARLQALLLTRGAAIGTARGGLGG